MSSSKNKHTAVLQALLFSLFETPVPQFKCFSLWFSYSGVLSSLNIMFTVPCVTCLHTFMFQVPDSVKLLLMTHAEWLPTL